MHEGTEEESRSIDDNQATKQSRLKSLLKSRNAFSLFLKTDLGFHLSLIFQDTARATALLVALSFIQWVAGLAISSESFLERFRMLHEWFFIGNYLIVGAKSILRLLGFGREKR